MPCYARRHQLPGNLIYHIWNRANRRFDLFHDEDACVAGDKDFALKLRKLNGRVLPRRQGRIST